MTSVGERIKNRRKQLGMSVDELAEKLGKNRATVYRYESNDIENMPAGILEPLAKTLRTTPAYLLGYDDTISKESVSESKKNLDMYFDMLNDAGQKKALEYVIDLAENERYQKENEYYVPEVLAASRPNKEMTDDDRIDLQNVLKLVEQHKQKESSGKKQD